ncbi:MAG: hypothetical protein ACR2O3_02850 [Rhizobiaceae bacterium]
MSTPKAKAAEKFAAYPTYSPTEFNRRIEEGVKRAPEERAKALKEFWGWITAGF